MRESGMSPPPNRNSNINYVRSVRARRGLGACALRALVVLVVITGRPGGVVGAWSAHPAGGVAPAKLFSRFGAPRPMVR